VLGGKAMGNFGKAFKQYTGVTLQNVSTAALGGLFFAGSNQVLARYAKPVYQAMVSVPLIGTALPNILMGAALKALAGFAPKGVLRDSANQIAEGLVISAAVGIGVQATQLIPIPGLSPVNPA